MKLTGRAPFNGPGPWSMCYCGHTGDHAPQPKGKELSQHADAVGHGFCKAEGCRCNKFTWARWLTEEEASKHGDEQKGLPGSR